MVQAGEADVPNLIKIDTEGYESAVVAGLKSTIVRHNPCLLLEEGEDVDTMIGRHGLVGYRRFYVTEDGQLTANPEHPRRTHNGALIPSGVDVSALVV